MRLHWKGAVILGPWLLLAAEAATAQPASPPQPTGASETPLYDPSQLPSLTGVVQHFTLTPRGDIDGFILADGTEVKLPPHLSTEIAYVVRLGDTVTIHGLKAAALPLMRAASVTDAASGKTVVDNGPPAPGPNLAPPPPPPPPPGPAGADQGGDLVQGRVRMPLHGPEGDVNGVLLDDGVIVRLPPPEAARFADLLTSGASLAARGTEQRSVLGIVLEARAIGTSPETLTPLAGPPDRRPPGPPRRP